ncbi:hypothetical protein PoB_001576500 [Plakobranchus ocellatus]|uniref:Uncharacterized protein n=1 Tax=Plakobranchus ocellatus TaxID=259542 RepID=A0AAV3Z3R5_9GAST|nr:hypothetical protein PoB_001576500 [Plakobranchus ocellatus]
MIIIVIINIHIIIVVAIIIIIVIVITIIIILLSFNLLPWTNNIADSITCIYVWGEIERKHAPLFLAEADVMFYPEIQEFCTCLSLHLRTSRCVQHLLTRNINLRRELSFPGRSDLVQGMMGMLKQNRKEAVQVSDGSLA